MLISIPKFPIEMMNVVLEKDTGKLMEYCGLMKNPKYRKLYAQSYTKDLGRIAQLIPGQFIGANTIFFIDKKEVPIIRCREVTYA